MKKLKREDFKKMYGEIYYFYRFMKNRKRYELCLEPCLNGFDVALYEMSIQGNGYAIVMPKKCTDEDVFHYQYDLLGMNERLSSTWEKALRYAETMLSIYFKPSYERPRRMG